ncbi:MAG: mannose-1-phosphate guanylyltransferase [Verrucomicrobiota bacterium]|nr:mannose-1-phosphate guanylyltransferase [Verrucomicrobiota bacterium]
MDKCYAVIMAGGRGRRFWPLSAAKRPKQVLAITGDKPLIALAVERLGGLIPPERAFVIAGAQHVGAIGRAAPNLPKENIVGEPVGRDTAAVCALASALIKARDPSAAFCILTADHIIRDIDVFQETLRQGFDTALKRPALLTIGIRPTFPCTGYGYIEFGDASCASAGIEFFKVRRFVEKPDAATAEAYIRAGNFCWNSGMFIWTVETFQNALARYQPPLLAMAARLQAAVGTRRFAASLAEEYNAIERISVDHAIMEKADNILMARGAFRWHDVGSWSALADLLPANAQGNITIGMSEALDASGNIVVSSERPTMLLGVSGLVVVQAAGATLVCDRERTEDVKKLVDLLEKKGGYEAVL